jgi:hypothetical protein
LVASRSVFSLFSTDEETFANALMWKNLRRTRTALLPEKGAGGTGWPYGVGVDGEERLSNRGT